jgi:protein TonB
MSRTMGRAGLRAALARRLCGALAMLAGTAGVFGAIAAMNLAGAPPPAAAHGPVTELVVDPRPPREVRRRPPPPPPRPRRAPARSAAPTPTLAAALSGVDLGLGSVGGLGLEDAARALTADAASARELVMTEATVDQPPRAAERSAPRYPPRARAEGVSGQVSLSLLIDADGRVLKVEVVDAAPPGVFDAAAVEAVRGWRFEPARYRGQPVKVWARQVVKFALL